MNQKYHIILVIVLSALICLATGFAQTSSKGRSKVGGLKLPDRAFGFFGAARHINQEPTFSGYVNYAARFSLWVGGVTSKGETFVTAGTGNEVSRRPEWSPIHPSFEINSVTTFPQVEKIISLSYSDAEQVTGHESLDLQVDQQVYEFKNSGFAILDFAITLDRKAKSLNNAYVGFWADVDAPDSQDAKSAANDQVGFASNGLAPYIFDSSIKGNEVPLLGGQILGVSNPTVSWWKDADNPVGDEQEYAYLQGDVPKPNPSQLNDFYFLLSYGPMTLKPGETIHFPVVLVQANEVNDFEDNLDDAEEFFNEEMGGISLPKQSLSAPTASAAGLVPEAFQLHQNFPNPFNPETQIRFDLAEATAVEIQIYNALGQFVRTLVAKSYPAGTFTVTWDGRDESGVILPSGIYFYRITAGNFQAQRKLLFLK